MRGRVVAVWFSTFLALACGASEGGDPGRDGNGGSGGAGAGSGGSAGGSGGSSGSSSGGAGAGSGGSSSGTGGSAGAPPGDCAAPFTTTRVVFTPDPNAAPPSSLSVTDDELELYYVRAFFHVRRRGARTDAFSAESELSELASVCPTATAMSADVTGDGLRLYFTCGEGAVPVRLATRADRNSPFVVDPNTFGTVEASLSVSSDELTLFSVINNGENGQSLIHTRVSTSEPFGPGSPVPGINQPFRFPELSADGSTLFGSMAPTPQIWRLARATRDAATGSFSTPTTDGLPASPAVPPEPTSMIIQGDYTPTVAGACRSLYFSRSISPNVNTLSWTVEVAEH